MGHFDTNLFLEDLVLLLLNTVCGYQLENINHKIGKNNVKGIDLIDESNKICVQVSSRIDIGKIQKTVKSVAETKELYGFHLIYFALTDKSTHKKTSDLPYGNSKFSFSEDYFDFSHIIDVIKSKPDFSRTIYDILNNWIGNIPISEFGKKYSVSRIEDLKRYYTRTVSIPAENEYKAYFEKELYPSDTLYNFVSKKVKGYENNKLWLLVSAAQVGKSYEAIHLFRQLQSDDIHYPIFIKARDFDTDKEVIALPFYAPIHKMVLIVDGFDELPENKRHILYKFT